MLTHPATQNVEFWPIKRLREYPRNPRKNDAAVDRMCASIREFGFKIPCLARSDGEVVDGHLRLKAARKLGITEIPVILCDEWSPAQVKAFRLMVTRTWAACAWRCRIGLPNFGYSKTKKAAEREPGGAIERDYWNFRL
jgi:hypothetical protein